MSEKVRGNENCVVLCYVYFAIPARSGWYASYMASQKDARGTKLKGLYVCGKRRGKTLLLLALFACLNFVSRRFDSFLFSFASGLSLPQVALAQLGQAFKESYHCPFQPMLRAFVDNRNTFNMKVWIEPNHVNRRL